MRTTLITLAALTATAHAQTIEISDDNHTTTALHPSPTDCRGYALAGSSVPFHTEPDQIVELRRQIGGLQIADVNNDGLNDVIAVCYISNSFPPYEDWHDQIYFNLGDHIETTPSWLSDIETHTGDVQIGDVNGDTYPDILTVHGGTLRTDSVRVYSGSESGPDNVADYISTTPQSCWGTSGLLVDLDNDGDLDAVTTNQGLSPDPYRPMYQFENTGTALAPAPVWQSAEQSIQSGLAGADFDGDSFTDVGVAKWVDFHSAVYHNDNGTLQTTPAWTVTADDTDKGAAAADVDGDGLTDIYFGGDPATGWRNDTDLDFSLTWQSDAPFQGPQDFRFFDVDADGDQDLAEIHFSTGRCHIYLNDNGALATEPSWSYDAPEVGTALAFGDINGDGLADLVTGYSGDVSLRVFFAEPASCPADVNGDGNLNILDFLAFQNAFSNGDDSADCNADGALNVLDFICYQNVFQAGCP